MTILARWRKLGGQYPRDYVILYGNESSVYYLIRYNHRVTARQVFTSEVYLLRVNKGSSCFNHQGQLVARYISARPSIIIKI